MKRKKAPRQNLKDLRYIIEQLERDKAKYLGDIEAQKRYIDELATRNIKLIDLARQFAEAKALLRTWLKE
jgi:hypothetical protein